MTQKCGLCGAFLPIPACDEDWRCGRCQATYENPRPTRFELYCLATGTRPENHRGEPSVLFVNWLTESWQEFTEARRRNRKILARVPTEIELQDEKAEFDDWLEAKATQARKA